jgi:serine/threonine protein kinase/Tfp pilus assembly protein PilF
MVTKNNNEIPFITPASETPTIPDAYSTSPDGMLEGAENFQRLETGALLGGRYEILSLLGKGGMGEVYLAADKRINRRVALKVLNHSLVSSEDGVRRFVQEAEAVSALNHPHIITIHEVDTTDDGIVFFVSEFVEGQTLDRVAKKGIPMERALDIAMQIASALSAAHEAGIVHRDIKPENVMVRPDGYVKVLDFGLAKLAERKAVSTDSASEEPTKGLLETKVGSVLGTPAYMSPEQARGLKVDQRTDLWSLGVLLYELITGSRPFRGDTAADMVAAILMNEPPPVSMIADGVDPDIDRVVAKALTKDVGLRYQTALELRSDLELIKKGLNFRSDWTPSLGAAYEGQQNGSNERDLGEGAVRGATAGENARSTRGDNWRATKFVAGVGGPAGRSSSRIIVLAVAAVILLSVAAVFIATSGSGGTAAVTSIAVLPFENLTGDPGLAYVTDGLSDRLIDRFSELPQLKVISRSSSFKLRGAGLEPRDAAAKLAVGAIVSGSVERIGDELLVRFEIIDASEDRHLAGGQFRRKAGDLLGMQSEIAQRAADQLRLKLSGPQSVRIANNGTGDSEAFRYYLSGLVELNGPQDVRGRALEYFEKAVSLDPNFADAHAEIAWVLWARANGSSEPGELIPRARASVEKAIAADQNNAKAHVVRAMMMEHDFDWAGAEAEYRRAIELNPNLDFARNNYAFFLSVMGRQDEALAELEQQRLRDPINLRLGLLQKGIVLTQARRFDDALAAYRDAQAAEPERSIPNFPLGYAYAGKGSVSESVEYYKRAIAAMGGEEKYSQPLVYLAAAYARIDGRRAEGRKIIARIESAGGYASPALLAAAYSEFGDRDRAMVLLEEAYIKRDPLLRFIGTGYEYDGLREDARFVDLTKRIGLAR